LENYASKLTGPDDRHHELIGRAAWATWKVAPPSRNEDPTRSTRDQEDEELAR